LSKKLKILVFVDWFYPGFKAGGPVQSCINLINACENDFDFYVVCGDRDLGDQAPYRDIETGKWNRYKRGGHVLYANPENIGRRFIGKLLAELAPDIVYVNGIFSWKFSVLPVIACTHQPLKVIVAPRGMLQEGALKIKAAKKRFFLLAMRAAGYYRKILFHATDEQEQKDILKNVPVCKGSFVAANFPHMHTEEWTEIKKTPGELKLTFLSRISPKKNLLFVLLCLQQLVNIKLRFTIAGEIDDIPYWNSCLEEIKKLPLDIQVEKLEAIPNHLLKDFYKQQHVFILSSFGENYGHAIVEALIYGKPVIISDKTPWRNLELKKIGFDIALDQPNKFIAALAALAGYDQEQYNQWSKAAWEYGKSIQSNAAGLKNIYKENFTKEAN
jgi:glycosyltransferase involved in cell wall biosynthesis